MNQSGSKELTLSAREARDLHTEIYDLLEQVAELERKLSMAQVSKTVVDADGGAF